MREMHKWKDKTEFSLDNRQIFFLFFGLSVIGCFVFALGIMTGRRLQWIPGQDQEGAAVAEVDSLSLLDGDEAERFSFEDGLAQSDAAELPPTRDPAIPPRDERKVVAERAAVPTPAPAVEQRQADADAVEAVIADSEKTLAAVAKVEGPRRFTLQMKAFSRREDADKLVGKLQSNGHDVRIETHDVRGRTWHRVRLGEFDNWEEALHAKQEFEAAEKVIAYVVSL